MIRSRSVMKIRSANARIEFNHATGRYYLYERSAGGARFWLVDEVYPAPVVVRVAA